MNQPDLPAGVTFIERGWLSANQVLIETEIETLLIDSGYCTHELQTVQLVDHVLRGRPLDHLVNTHLHSDHCGGNRALQQTHPFLTTWIPPGHFQAVQSWDETQLSYKATGQLCHPFIANKTLSVGDDLPLSGTSWGIHAAPGHDPHSLVFFEPVSQLLISADALWENGFGVVFPELEGSSAFSEVASTLDLIEKLNPNKVLPGHGPAFENIPAALAAARRRLDFFQSNPLKHKIYACKVLISYKLMELAKVDVATFLQWATQCPYLQLIASDFCKPREMEGWVKSLLTEMAEKKNIYVNGNFLYSR